MLPEKELPKRAWLGVSATDAMSSIKGVIGSNELNRAGCEDDLIECRGLARGQIMDECMWSSPREE